MLKKILFLTVPAALVGGCTPVDYGFGETTRWNMEQQVVDPDPQYAGELIEGHSGRRAAAAVDRYNRGQVTQPVSTGTSGSGGSGIGGSGSSTPG